MNNLICEYQRSASAQHILIYFVLQYIYLISIMNIWRVIFGKFPLTRLFGSLEFYRTTDALLQGLSMVKKSCIQLDSSQSKTAFVFSFMLRAKLPSSRGGGTEGAWCTMAHPTFVNEIIIQPSSSRNISIDY